MAVATPSANSTVLDVPSMFFRHGRRQRLRPWPAGRHPGEPADGVANPADAAARGRSPCRTWIVSTEARPWGGCSRGCGAAGVAGAWAPRGW